MGGSAWVIVAIPEKDDYVWQLSSEKVPHMTLLFLGEPASDISAQNIVEYLQHTADTSIRRFGMNVDRRGLLGPEDADVLFFEKNFGFERINEARSYLLKNDDIAKAHGAAEQYPDWIPHLTLGYPDKPAKPDKRDYPGVHWVNFDRIALWTEDFSGFEIQLQRDNGMETVSMADLVDEHLAHYGVKGMKWGVRKQQPSRSSGSEKPKPKKATAPEGKPDRGKDGRIRTAPARKTSVDSSKKPQDLSDEELRRAIARIDMERRFAQLTATPASEKSTARKFVEEILMDVGRTQAKQLLNGVATKQMVSRGIIPKPGKGNK